MVSDRKAPRRIRDISDGTFATCRFAGERLEVRLLLKPKELTGYSVRLEATAESMGAGVVAVGCSPNARVISKLPGVGPKRPALGAPGAAPVSVEPLLLKNKRRALINKGPKAFKKADAPASFKRLAAAAAALKKAAVLNNTIGPQPTPLPAAPPSGWHLPIMPTASEADELAEPSDSADASTTRSQVTPSGMPLLLPSDSSHDWSDSEEDGGMHASTTASASLLGCGGLVQSPPPADVYAQLRVRSLSEYSMNDEMQAHPSEINATATSIDFGPAAPKAALSGLDWCHPPLSPSCRPVASPRADSAFARESPYFLINSAPPFLPLSV